MDTKWRKAPWHSIITLYNVKFRCKFYVKFCSEMTFNNIISINYHNSGKKNAYKFATTTKYGELKQIMSCIKFIRVVLLNWRLKGCDWKESIYVMKLKICNIIENIKVSILFIYPNSRNRDSNNLTIKEAVKFSHLF